MDISKITTPVDFVAYLEDLKKMGNKECIFEKKEGEFVGKTYDELYTDVNALAKFLIKQEYGNKKIAIIGENSYKWFMSYVSIVAYVGIVVPIDVLWSEYEINNVLDYIDISCFLCDYASYNRLSQLCKERQIDCFNFETDSKNMLNTNVPIEMIRKRPEEVCEILFTSGTSSKPKAVMLSQSNILANGDDIRNSAYLSDNEKYLVVLPIHHIYTGVLLTLYPLHIGTQIYFSGVKTLREDLQLVKPTVFPGVPRIFETVLDTIDDETMKKIKKAIKLSNFLRRLGFDLRRKIFSKFHHFWGGNINYLISGAAGLDQSVAKIYDDMGLLILQGYGLSEASPVISMSNFYDYRIGSVGKVLPSQQVQIINKDEKGVGEIIVKGKNITSGYYNNDDLNQVAFTENGYFCTGDLGYLEDDYLYITGRKKRVIITSNGENVEPEEIENLILKNLLINRANVYSKDNAICAAIYINIENKVHAADIINKVNDLLPKYKKIKNYEIIYGEHANPLKK